MKRDRMSPIRRALPLVLSLAAALALTPAARANDSTAELRAGGLVLKKTDAIAMRSEDLFISPERVRVVYEFENLTKADVETEVAFPLPDVPGGEEPVEIPNPASDNFVNFTTKIDYSPVALTIEQRAFLDQEDVTALLAEKKIPLSPRHPDVEAAVLALPPADRAALEKRGLVQRQDYNAGPGMQVGYTANWRLQTRVWRRQVFPAGRRVRVEHTYQPAIGSSAGTMLATNSKDYADQRAQEMAKYCVDPPTRAAIARRMKGRGEGGMPVTTLGYVLTTGANWARPIGDFRLVVDKGDARNLVSFCETGVKKISPTRYEVRHKNFTPRSDLEIIILRPPYP